MFCCILDFIPDISRYRGWLYHWFDMICSRKTCSRSLWKGSLFRGKKYGLLIDSKHFVYGCYRKVVASRGFNVLYVLGHYCFWVRTNLYSNNTLFTFKLQFAVKNLTYGRYFEVDWMPISCLFLILYKSRSNIHGSVCIMYNYKYYHKTL